MYVAQCVLNLSALAVWKMMMWRQEPAPEPKKNDQAKAMDRQRSFSFSGFCATHPHLLGSKSSVPARWHLWPLSSIVATMMHANAEPQQGKAKACFAKLGPNGIWELLWIPPGGQHPTFRWDFNVLSPPGRATTTPVHPTVFPMGGFTRSPFVCCNGRPKCDFWGACPL